MTTNRKIKRKTEEPPKVDHSVSDDSVASAMRSARIPARFGKVGITLDTFVWGKRMKNWISTVLLNDASRDRSFFLATPEDEAIAASSMLARTLVLRGYDATWVSLDEINHDRDLIRDNARFIVIAGFYSDQFNKQHGCPIPADKLFSLSWALWRAANAGSQIIAVVSPSQSYAERWWTNGALHAAFNFQETLNIKRNAV